MTATTHSSTAVFVPGASSMDDPATHPWACECPPCRDRRSRYKKHWRLAKHRGAPSGFTNPAPTLAHIRNNLLPAAWTRMQIGYAAGIDPCYIAELLGEQSKTTPHRLRVETADAILQLGPADRLRNVPDAAPVDPTGTRRRMQALAIKGHRIERLLKDMHCSNGLLYGKYVSARNARRIVDLYDQLWRTEGPSRVTALRARNRGWVGPGAWDDDTIDDPRAVPEVGEDQPVWSNEELLAEAEVAAQSSADPGVIARRVGVSVVRVARAQERAKSRGRAAEHQEAAE